MRPVLPAAMETQHSRVRKQTRSLPCSVSELHFSSADVYLCSSESISPEENRRAAPLQALMSTEARGPSGHWWVFLYNSIIIKLCYIFIHFRSCVYLFVFPRNVGDGERFMSASRGKSITTNNSRWPSDFKSIWPTALSVSRILNDVNNSVSYRFWLFIIIKYLLKFYSSETRLHCTFLEDTLF